MRPSPETATGRSGGRHGFPWRAAGAVLVAIVALVGAAQVGAALDKPAPVRPPQPAAGATGLPGTGTTGAGSAVDGTATGTDGADRVGSGLPRSAPTAVRIARLGMNASVMPLGLNADGTVQVPPLEQADFAGWYEPGVSPGELGNAVLVGHVDSYAMGPAVFFRLGELVPGDLVEVARADGRVVRFTVDGVRSYPKTAFPAELVYGPSSRAAIRLVTCGGVFDEQQRTYPDNVVVFATAA